MDPNTLDGNMDINRWEYGSKQIGTWIQADGNRTWVLIDGNMDITRWEHGSKQIGVGEYPSL